MPTYNEKDILSKDQFFLDGVAIASRVVAVENLTADLSALGVEERNKLLALSRAVIKEVNNGSNILAIARVAAATGTDDSEETPSDWGDNLEIISEWVAYNSYSSGDKVTNGGLVYEANTNHTALGDFVTDAAKWDATSGSAVNGIAGLEIEAVVRKVFPFVAGVALSDK
jgi:hypothetical protein